MRVEGSEIGIMGTGTNFFRCGLVHSSGAIYLGTYGPKPAIVWKYNPQVGRLKKIGTPGEYQLDCMVEAPNGIVYIGTAYSAFVYRLDPETDSITCLGSPPIESTSWIFTMICTRGGEIYGAKGVGLFRLDWENDRLEAIGTIPGDHRTPGPGASEPIVRQLEEAPDGTIWGDTNRWLFRFDPRSLAIEPLVDMLTVDLACYALFLPQGPEPTQDCHFAIFSRFSGEQVAMPFYVYRSAAQTLEALPISGWRGTVVGHPEWWTDPEGPRLLMPTWHEEEQGLRVSVVDPFARRVVERWEIDSNLVGAHWLAGGGAYCIGSNRGHLLRVEPERRRLSTVAENPVSVECRCLAISAQRLLGTDTYDCGYAFTRDLVTGEIRDHGKVWRDDHRANYGPAAFAGGDGRYFLANHSEGMPALWVTDTRTNRHWRVGDAAIQLVAMGDGKVWGTIGPSQWSYAFDPQKCWLPGWQAKGGQLFCYRPGAMQVDVLEGFEQAGPIAEAPNGGGRVLVSQGRTLYVLEPGQVDTLATLALPEEPLAAAHDVQRRRAYLVLRDGAIYALQEADGDQSYVLVWLGEFGSVERGFFVLSHSGRVVGVARDGATTVLDPGSKTVAVAQGPIPLPAGPAVDPRQDAWYYAHQAVLRYSIVE